jgi:hypothetical protein
MTRSPAPLAQRSPVAETSISVALGEIRLADLSPKDVYAWRADDPGGAPVRGTQALRQVLNRAVAWGLIDYNPAKRGVPNPMRRSKEKRPFESWQQVDAVAERLGPVYGPDDRLCGCDRASSLGAVRARAARH